MDMFHLARLRSICARAKNPIDLVDGKSLDELAHYTRHRLSQKGKHLWDQIQTSYCYAECLCHIYDFTYCSNIERKHLPFQCEFNENEILSSYAKGVYDYFDVEKIEEFVPFKGAYEIASLIEKYYDTIHKSENFVVLAYCFENYTSNAYIEDFKIECLLPEKRLMIALMRSPMIPRTHLILPFLMILILSLLMAMMPLWMMITKMNLL